MLSSYNESKTEMQFSASSSLSASIVTRDDASCVNLANFSFANVKKSYLEATHGRFTIDMINQMIVSLFFNTKKTTKIFLLLYCDKGNLFIEGETKTKAKRDYLPPTASIARVGLCVTGLGTTSS